jgi:hypothetical protein
LAATLQKEIQLVVEWDSAAGGVIRHHKDSRWYSFALQKGERVIVEILITVIEGNRRNSRVIIAIGFQAGAEFVQIHEAVSAADPIQTWKGWKFPRWMQNLPPRGDTPPLRAGNEDAKRGLFQPYKRT